MALLGALATQSSCTGDCTGPDCASSFAAARLAVHRGGALAGGHEAWDDASGRIDGTEATGADWAVSSAGDLLVLGQPDVATVQVVLEPVGVEALDPLARWYGATGSRFGESVTAGVPDSFGRWNLLVGAPDTSLERGAVHVFRNAQLLEDDSGADVVLTGATPGDHFGSVVSRCGDINGDGEPDWAATAPGFSQPTEGAFAGDTVVIPNLAGAVFLLDERDLSATSGEIDALEATRFWWGGFAAKLGTALDCASDLDGDGLTDLVIGAPFEGDADPGAVYIVHGAPEGTLSQTGSIVDIAARTLLGSEEDGWFGYAVVTADFDGDRVVDLAVGSPGFDNGRGAAQVFEGTNLATAPTPAAAVTVQVPIERTAGDHAGRYLAAGDINGGGRADLLVGAPDWLAPSAFDAGYIAMWLGESAPWTDMTFSESEELAIFGTQPFQRTGHAMYVADLDGDGSDDIALPTRSAD